MRFRILTPQPSPNIAAASNPVCSSLPVVSTKSGRGIKERRSTMAMNPMMNSGTMGGSFELDLC